MGLYLYILKCSDNSYYTGVTNNIENRLLEHQTGLNNRCYTYRKRPVQLLFCELFNDNMQGIEWEKKVKGWSRKKKDALIAGDYQSLHVFAECMNSSHFKERQIID